MVKPPLSVKIIAILLVVTFISGQVHADISSLWNDKLAASLVTDPDINTTRSTPVLGDIAGKVKPGAIGNGIPLRELAGSKLPPRITLEGRELVLTFSKLREALSMAFRLSVTNKEKVPAKHKKRVEQTLANLTDLSNRLEKRAYLYNADIRGPEDYLIGFNFKESIGLSVELIDRLYSISPDRLAQYIFHECVPEKGIITERDDHRAVYSEIQSAIFGQDEVLALKRDLRGFIIEKNNIKISDDGRDNTQPISSAGLTMTPEKLPYREFRKALNALPEKVQSKLYKLSSESMYSPKLWRTHQVKVALRILRSNNIPVPEILAASGVYDGGENDPWYKSALLGVIHDILPEPTKQVAEHAVAETVQISEDLPVRAKLFAVNLSKILTEHQDMLFFVGVENDIGEAQKAQIMPIYKAIDQIEKMTDSAGNRLFPNLMMRRAKAEELATIVSDLNKEGKLNLSNAFIGAKKFSVDSKIYDAIGGEGRAWIAAIDDSRPGDYLPVFEAITLNMMAYLSADLAAIKRFYDAISDDSIDPKALQGMIRNRIIYILPRATKFDTKQRRALYELAQQVYVAA